MTLFDHAMFDVAALSGVSLLVKSSAVVALGVAGARLASRTAARVALVWTMVFVAVAALPWLDAVLPSWQITAIDVRHDLLEATACGGLQLCTSLGLAVIWAAGVCVMFLRVGLDWRAASALARRADPVLDERVERLLHVASRLASAGRMPTIRETPELATAAVIGHRRPVILLPSAFASWSDDELLGVLCHEMEHIRRSDWVTLIGQRIVTAIYWPNPLVHLAARWLSASRELAADDAVLRAGVHLDVYAGRLIDIARVERATYPPVAALALTTGSGVETRVRALFDARRDRRRMSRGAAIAVAIVSLPIAVAVAGAQPWACVPASASAASATCP